jgi:hypothetical protein
LEEEDGEEKETEENFPKKAGKKPTKEKCEEVANKEKILGIQTTLKKTLITISRNTKTPGSNILLQGSSQKTQVK